MPTRRARMLVALLLALAVGAFAKAHFGPGSGARSDLAFQWYGAAVLWRGGNPYTEIGPGRRIELNVPPLHPAPALVLVGPLTLLSLDDATALFPALGAAVFAFCVTRRRWLPLAAALSWPFLLTVISPQWALLMAAAAVTPALAWLATVKPNIGLALACYRPTRRWILSAVIGGAILTAIAFALQPTWVADWLAALRSQPASSAVDGRAATAYYLAPVTLPGGFLLLAALLRWRRPEARLLVAMACVPHTPTGYELLPLLALVPESLLQALLLAAGSWLVGMTNGWLSPLVSTPTSTLEAFVATGSRYVWGVYLPCLVLVLARPNEGAVPAWLERGLARTSLVRRSRRAA